MKAYKILVLIAPLLITEASAMDGNELKRFSDAYLRTKQSTYTSSTYVADAGRFCGYVQGVTESLVSFTFCPPTDVTLGQTYAIVIEYLNDNPAKWNQHASNLIREAMTQAYPCPNKDKIKTTIQH
jgi:hypothetical protein